MPCRSQTGLRPSPELTVLGKALLNLDEAARTLAPDLDPDEVIRGKAAEIVERLMAVAVGSFLLAVTGACALAATIVLSDRRDRTRHR